MAQYQKININYLRQQIISIGKELYNYNLSIGASPRVDHAKVYKGYEALTDLKQGNSSVSFDKLMIDYDIVRVLNITSVAALSDINVAHNTAFNAIPLPETVTVTYEDSSTASRPVTWIQGTYNGAIAATYNLTGTINLAKSTTNSTSKVAHVNVIVAA